MLFFNYFKAQPTEFVIHFRKGKVVRQGEGLSFLYYAPTSNIIRIPLGNQDQPFIFNEITSDFQDITVQGNLTYRITDPVAISRAMNFTLDASGRAYSSEDPEKLAMRLVNRLQVIVRSHTQAMKLTDALEMDATSFAEIQSEFAASKYLGDLGIEVLELSITAIKPSPQTSEALQTRERERLLQQADDAIYARRNAAVEAERTIRENELTTEQAIELQKREIQEAKLDSIKAEQKKRQEMETSRMNADIALEEKKESLVKLAQTNSEIEANAASYKLRKQLEPINELSPKIVQSLAAMNMNPSQLIAQAFGDFASNAEKIGSLNISQDVLVELMEQRGK